VVICYNEAERIGKLLKCVSGQTISFDEAIFVDGGSTDGTIDLIKREVSYAKVISESGKRSPANARNIGIQEASCDVIVVLDADHIFEDRYVEKIKIEFEKYPDADGISFKQKLIIPSSMGIFEKALFLRDEVYGFDGIHTIPSGKACKEVYYDPELGVGEDRLVREQIAGRKLVNSDTVINVSKLTYSDVRGLFNRYLWYGRTSNDYFMKSHDVMFNLFVSFAFGSVVLWLVLGLIGLFPALCLSILYGAYRAIKISRMGYFSYVMLLFPFIELVGIVGIGIGVWQRILGNRVIGR
jgi:glycosyltransferase involved in cell wall biosynthesis